MRSFWYPISRLPWWRHQMETFSALLAICAENSPVPGEFPAQRPVTRSFDIFFDLRLNKRLSKQWWGWWFETLAHPLWRHRNGSNKMSFTMCIAVTVTSHDRRGAWNHWPLDCLFKSFHRKENTSVPHYRPFVSVKYRSPLDSSPKKVANTESIPTWHYFICHIQWNLSITTT